MRIFSLEIGIERKRNFRQRLFITLYRGQGWNGQNFLLWALEQEVRFSTLLTMLFSIVPLYHSMYLKYSYVNTGNILEMKGYDNNLLLDNSPLIDFGKLFRRLSCQQNEVGATFLSCIYIKFIKMLSRLISKKVSFNEGSS